MSKDKWRKSEQRACNSFNGKIVPCSGALADNKLDIEILEGALQGFRIENKFTEKGSYSLKLETLLKAKHQALITGNKEFIRLDMEDANGKFHPHVIIRESLFKELLCEKEENH